MTLARRCPLLPRSPRPRSPRSGARGGRGRVALAATLAAALAAACGDGEAGRGPPGGETVRVGVSAGATTLLPPLAAAALDYELSGALYLALNHAVWEDGRLAYPLPHPLALARASEIAADGRTLTYRLDTTRRWSDGRPVTARDVRFTYGLLADPELGLPLSSVTAQLDSVTAPDDSTAVFHFRRPYPGMRFDTGVGIVPEHVYGGVPPAELEGLPRYRDGGETPLVTSGPFTLESWAPADRIVLRRSEGWPGGTGAPRIAFLVLPDESARAAALRAAELEAAQLTSFRTATELRGVDGIRIESVPRRAFDYVAWNPAGHPAFADPDVRRALSLAIDREALIAGLDMQGFAEPAFGPYGPLFPELATPPPDPTHDAPLARRLLDAAGWRDRDGDGVREREGVRLEFELATQAGSERREAVAEIVAEALGEVGARASVRRQEFGSLLERARRREFQALLLGWQVSLDPDISGFWGDPQAPFNFVGYDDPHVRALMDTALARPTAEEAAPYWRRAGDRVAADHPYAFLWYFDLPWAVRPELEGVEADPVGFARTLHEWRRAPRDGTRRAARPPG